MDNVLVQDIVLMMFSYYWFVGLLQYNGTISLITADIRDISLDRSSVDDYLAVTRY